MVEGQHQRNGLRLIESLEERRPNLVGRSPAEIAALVEPHVDRSYRAQQVAQWVIHRHAVGFHEMSNLSKELRNHLDGHFRITDPALLDTSTSNDGSVKLLLGLDDGAAVECVSMPENGKLTMCLSSQTGCAVGCAFCVTGALGAGRNLRPDEIVGQYRVILSRAEEPFDRINIVFMGMGEPLLNTSNLGAALDCLYERVSPKRITVSTAGVLPGIRWLAGLPRRPKLALSLNAPNQELRQRLMPVSRKYPLEELMAALRQFPLERGRRITFEYVLIRGVNDAPADARAVTRLLHGIPSKVNVIPLNEDPDHFPDLERPDDDDVNRFAMVLRDAGLTVTVRWSKGLDVDAACGQLKGRHQGTVSSS
ncbi:MAG: 23S rRNA (adenine(2503)-C(2))-methyltransferase RlmN [Thermoanaerobaculales bacterium]|jgi:23S rRNA (adenine2503-C2)-methyltransferase|nr:23S rRNA (adenine(2503)-C(2))-methyltransferase RlmN [Thermoanaerobaculales bacterium]